MHALRYAHAYMHRVWVWCFGGAASISHRILGGTQLGRFVSHKERLPPPPPPVMCVIRAHTRHFVPSSAPCRPRPSLSLAIVELTTVFRQVCLDVRIRTTALRALC